MFSNEITNSGGRILQSDLDHWRKAGYTAIDQLVDRLKNQIAGKDVEDIN